MHEIDFLPAEYRQKDAQRQSKPWRVVVVGVFVAVIGFAAAGQHRRRAMLEDELIAVGPKYEAIVKVGQEVEALQQELDLAAADAELFTYLRHRWPQTQILDALLDPLPDEIAFEQLAIHRESPGRSRSGRPLSRAEREDQAQQLASLPAAAADLARLRQQYDRLETVVTVTGVTSQSAALHRYLGDLNQVDLFSKTELDTIESEAGTPELRFSLSLRVRPGYGQPGGPGPDPAKRHPRKSQWRPVRQDASDTIPPDPRAPAAQSAVQAVPSA